MSKLFDFSSLAMIPTAYKDGKLYSVRPVEQLGSELVTNGDFSSASDWTFSGGGVAISGGKLNFTGTTREATQSISVVNTKTYRVSYEVSNFSAGSVRAEIGSSTGAVRTANGIYSEYIVASGANTIQIDAVSFFTGSIDNVSVKEVLVANGDFDFSRGSNLAATRVDVNGLIEKGRENQAPYSNTYNSWVQTSVSLTSNQSGYDNSSDAWLIQSSATNSAAYINQNYTHSGVFTMSVYAKKGTSNWMALATTGSHFAHFDLENGVVGVATGANIIDHKIQSVGNGWYRCSMTSRGFSNFYVFIANGDNDRNTNSGDNIYIQDFQLEQGLVATDYIETGTSAAQSGILEDMPRLDYSGGASCPSLLLEPQRSNSIISSEYIDSWSKSEFSVDTNSATSPEGVVNASKIIPSTNNTGHYIDRLGFNRTANQYITHSVYVKPDGYNYFSLSNAANRLIANFELIGEGSARYVSSNGTDFANHSASIEAVGNGWYRCILIAQALNSVATYMRISCGSSAYNSSAWNGAGDGTSGVLVYGAQVELNSSYPTSYIPTYGTSQTRSKDAMNEQISGLTSLEQGTFFVDFDRGVTSSTSRDASTDGLFYRSGSSFPATNAIEIATDLDGKVRVLFRSPLGVLILDLQNATDRYKMLYKWNGNSLKLYVNGSVEYNSETKWGEITSPLEYIGYNADFRKSINQLLTFPTALTDSECIALTTL